MKFEGGNLSCIIHKILISRRMRHPKIRINNNHLKIRINNSRHLKASINSRNHPITRQMLIRLSRQRERQRIRLLEQLIPHRVRCLIRLREGIPLHILTWPDP